MSHSNSNFKLPRERSFSNLSTVNEELDTQAPQASFDDPNVIRFIIQGQGCLIYNFDKDQVNNGYSIILTNEDNTNKMVFYCTKDTISLSINDKVYASQNLKSILDDEGAYYWLSLDTQNLCLKFGIGEPRLETQEFSCNFEAGVNKSFKNDVLASFSKIEFVTQPFKNLKLLRDPIVSSVPLKVKNTDDLTMHDIAANTVLPKANLTTMGQKLYSNIAGENFVLNTPDFPDFTDAIEYSIATPGCFGYETLLKKSEEFGEPNPREVYLRITLGKNGGESPGIPYVMEIWPPNCYSPLHNHANANAVIRVLHGQIKVFLFPFLSKIEKISNDPILPINPDDAFGNICFASEVFSKDDITWISAVQNQTHQLYNPNVNGPTCITIQCYMYDESDTEHYAFFNYKVENSDKTGRFDPDSDMDFLDFKNTMKKEWEARNSK